MCQEAFEKVIDSDGRRVIREALEVWALAKANKPAPDRLTLNDYQELAARTINYANSSAEMEMHALHGMCGEIGELHSLYQKMYQGHQFDKEHAKKELGDLLWFIAEYCTACGFTLEDVAKANIEKLKARYPEGFEAKRSMARLQGDL
jgi:NTP pyrophosphatase (non-canonical NTP hydrolase)